MRPSASSVAVGRRVSFPAARFAMQKVDGSSPFIHFTELAGNGSVLGRGEQPSSGRVKALLVQSAGVEL